MTRAVVNVYLMAKRENILSSDGETISHQIRALATSSIVQNLFCVHARDATVVPQLSGQVRHESTKCLVLYT